MTKLELPWSIGDKIFYLDASSYSFEVECTFCHYTGVVTLNNGKPMRCGMCNGSKTHQRQRPFKFRPAAGVITGFEIVQNRGHESILNFHLNGNVCRTYQMHQIFATFYEARKAAQWSNKEYGWPKDGFDRWDADPITAHLSYPNRVYWGRKVRGSNKK